jgi:hypothetical protein
MMRIMLRQCGKDINLIADSLKDCRVSSLLRGFKSIPNMRFAAS